MGHPSQVGPKNPTLLDLSWAESRSSPRVKKQNGALHCSRNTWTVAGWSGDNDEKLTCWCCRVEEVKVVLPAVVVSEMVAKRIVRKLLLLLLLLPGAYCYWWRSRQSLWRGGSCRCWGEWWWCSLNTKVRGERGRCRWFSVERERSTTTIVRGRQR